DQYREGVVRMKDMLVRRAKSEDRKDAVFVEGQATPGLHYLDNVYEDWLVDPDGVLLVAEFDGRLVGVGKFSGSLTLAYYKTHSKALNSLFFLTFLVFYISHFLVMCYNISYR